MYTVTEYELPNRLQNNTSSVWKTDTSTECSLNIEDKRVVLCLL